MTPREAHFQRLLPANSAGGEGALRGIRSSQQQTIRHEDFSFGDFLDLINPLQHLPVVSQLYQNATGDTISPVAKMVGGVLLGGPIGFAVAGINAVFEEATGQSLPAAMLNPGEAPSQADYAARYHRIANAHRPDFHLFETA